MNRMDHNGV